MKAINTTIFSIIISLLFFSCEKKINDTETPSVTANPDADIELTQNGDYSSLFKSNTCSQIITESEISTLLGFPATNTYACNYEIKHPQDTFIIAIAGGSISIATVKSSIRNHKEQFSTYEISETGDTWLMQRLSLARIYMYNTNYSYSYIVSYINPGPISTLPQLKKDLRLRLCMKLANGLLHKHKI